ncbi:putative iron-sulfur-binding oxidoreductase FadF [subsurface metagenome]
MQAIAPSKEVIDIIKEEGGDVLKLCYQCGICTASCPWNLVRSFMVRKLIHQAQLGLVDFEDEDMWTCVGCKACVDRCPRGVEIVEIWRALRRVIVEVGVAKVPDSLRLTAKNFAGVGNPLGEPREKRSDWAKDLGVKTYTKGTEILYFPCCIQAYDPSNQRVARATVDILKKAEVDFGILGAELSCCGESIRKSGSETLFQTLAQNNIGVFNEAGVTKIVVTSPHCYHTFKEEYPEFGSNFEVIHFVQYLAELIKEGKLKFTKELNKKVTYQDSCCLGRYAGIYDEPRQILESIRGLELVEMRDYRENSLCCGGCSGRLWMETKKGERFSDLRIEQALEVEASILAVSCPYCMLNFEDSVLTSDKSDIIEIRDIAELVQEAL